MLAWGVNIPYTIKIWYSDISMELKKETLPKVEISKKELEKLKKRIENLEAKLNKEKITKEVLKRDIKNYIEEVGKISSSVSPLELRDEAKEIKKLSKTEQIGVLVSLTFEKSLNYAISVAKKLNNPAILDEFHDTLVDIYYQTLIEKNVIKPF